MRKKSAFCLEYDFWFKTDENRIDPLTRIREFAGEWEPPDPC